MTGNILEAVQGFATPAMIAAATSTLGLEEKQASGALGAAVTSILGAALAKTKDATTMTQVASLASSVMPDAGLFSNIAGMLTGGVPTSSLQIMGNRLIGSIFGSNQASAITALASAMGISGKASSGLMTLAAPMVLAAVRTKLGPAPTAAGVASLLNQDRNLIAQAMPAPLRTIYGLTDLNPAKPATVPAAAAEPAAVPPAAKPVTVAAPAPSSTVTPTAAAAVAPAVVATAAGNLPPSVAAMPAAHTSSGHASVPPATAAKLAPAVAAPVPPTAAPKPIPVVRRDDDTNPYYVPILLAACLLVGLPLLWYATVPPPAPPKPAAPAAAPAPAKVAAPAPQTPLLGQPGGIGLKYTLPGGASIEVAKNGVEQKLIEFITSSSEIDKKMWFDFDRLGFETGASDVTPASRAQLEALAAILKAYPATMVKIGGYTDNQGDPQANLKLSDNRAKRVMEELVKLGVAAGRLEAEGYGEQHAIGDNSTPEGRARNRRTALSVRAK